MTWPAGRDWLFSVKTFGAAMLALGIGLSAGLDRPYWAMASAYIASQPLSGATRSKAAFRLAGTVLGAAAALALVPNLAAAPELLSLAMACWTALCLTVALLDRTPRSYVFVLAAYTAPIIGFPSVGAPEAVWDAALARTEEIGLGIVCASVVASLVFPRHVGPAIAQQTEAWLRNGRLWALDVLEGTETPDRARMYRRRLAADAVELGTMTTHLAYDPSVEQQAVRAVRALQGRMLMLLPLLSSLSDRLAALRAAEGVEPGLAAVLGSVARWLRAGGPEQDIAGMRAALTGLEPVLDAQSVWGGIMLTGLLGRLRELIDLRQDCSALRAHIQAGRGGLPRLAGPDIPAAAQHRDPGMAVLSGLSAGLAVGLTCLFWIASAWPEGAVTAEMAAVGCCFFAAQDNPVPAIMGFLRWTMVAVVVDAVYLFAVLPGVSGFEVLALVLAPAFLVFGVLAARPATAPAGLALAANGATLLGLQASYSADFAAYANAGVATVVGMAAAVVLTQLVRSIGAEAGAQRLVRANWLSLAQAAERRGRGDRAAFAGLMLDRLGLVASRLATMTAVDSAPFAGDALAELRIGLNIVDLRRARHVLPQAAIQALDGVLDGIAQVFASRARSPLRQVGPPPQALLRRIDEAIAEVVAVVPPAQQRDALLGLGGIRRGLFPGAAPYIPEPRTLGPDQMKASVSFANTTSMMAANQLGSEAMTRSKQ